MFSLWRGDVLLGRIHPELPGDGDDALFGMLDPSAAFLPGEAVLQTTMLDWPGAPVFQHVGSPATTGATAPQRMSDRARPLSEALRDSVPIKDQLSLRDATNAEVATRTIAIQAMPSAGRSIQQRCQEVGVNFSGWCVIVGLANPARDAR